MFTGIADTMVKDVGTDTIPCADFDALLNTAQDSRYPKSNMHGPQDPVEGNGFEYEEQTKSTVKIRNRQRVSP